MRKLLLLVAAAFLMAGCEGDAGPTGPTGNANIQTGRISPTNDDWDWSSSWTLVTGPGSTISYYTRYVDVHVAEITADIVSDGAVLVYFTPVSNSGVWAPLPYTFLTFNLDYSICLVYEVMEGMIRLHYFYQPNTNVYNGPDLGTAEIPTYDFKYVVVGGTALEVMKAGGVDLSDVGNVIEYEAMP